MDCPDTRLTATRYHSLVIRKEKPARLSRSDRVDRRRRDHGRPAPGDLPVEGVQFHPESILTEKGHELLANFFANLKERNTHTEDHGGHGGNTKTRENELGIEAR